MTMTTHVPDPASTPSKSSHTATSPGIGQASEGKPRREGKDEKIARERGGHTDGRMVMMMIT